MRRIALRTAAASMAVLATTAIATTPALAAADDGPYVFDAAGSGQAVSIAVGLPQALADGLAPAVEQVPGVSIDGNELLISLASVLAELELPLVGESVGDATASASATSVTGSLQGLVETLTGGPMQCLDTPLDITVPPGAETPLVSMQLLQAECTTDAAGHTSIASSKIADLEVNLAGALAILPADVSAPVTDALDQVTGTVTDQVLTPIVDQVLTPVQDAINENLGLGVDLDRGGAGARADRPPAGVDRPDRVHHREPHRG